MQFPWGHNRRFNSYTQYLKKIFGYRVQKLTVNAGFTCPNRDGTKSFGGCTYCLNEAFNPSYCDPNKSIKQQIEEGIEFHKFRYRRAPKYIVYFQAYTNTYKPSKELKKIYEEALNHPEVVGISIGTRPDCINDDILNYLQSLSKKVYVSVEYGIESIYDSTLKLINRQHSFGDSVNAIAKTVSAGINTGAHIILGFPYETKEEMLYYANIISLLPLHTLKIHQLQIIRGTKMEEEYKQNPEKFNHFKNIDEYLLFLMNFIEKLNPNIMIERIAGEVPPSFNAGIQWKPRYDVVLQCFEKLLEKYNTWQGKFYKK